MSAELPTPDVLPGESYVIDWRGSKPVIVHMVWADDKPIIIQRLDLMNLAAYLRPLAKMTAEIGELALMARGDQTPDEGAILVAAWNAQQRDFGRRPRRGYDIRKRDRNQ